ncbi:BTB/POZ domain-containing protein 6-like [Mercenaria mercenaria]|uniref:BTB/POZ domain-containing protein 6-like n=1 Tax=Mercenaria mercenaria TaxID=6596 RepID=UPI00234E4FB3|nr:BTB/POZ domain-containing protein 6-like [Mercenaria mercenaria]
MLCITKIYGRKLLERKMDDTSNDWQSGKSLAETNLYMLDNGLGSDITFFVGNKGERVLAHKFMLTSRSQVFYAMFYGQLAETGQGVIIPDIEAEVMKTFLRFLYTEEVDITPDTVMALMYTAKKYAVQILVDKCRDYLETEINNDNVCTILEQAHLFDEQNLRNNCFTTIFSNSTDVLKSPLKDYQNLCYTCFKELLQSDKLRAREETIFMACLNWAEEQCRLKDIDTSDTNLRDLLGDMLFLIRFPNMDQRAFTELVSNRKLLTTDEKLAVYQQFNRSPRDGDVTLMGFRFSSKPRNSTEIFRASRFKDVFGGMIDFWDNDNDCDAISFSASRDINLFGVSIYRPFPDGIIRGCVKLYDETNWCMTKLYNLEILCIDGDETTVDKKFKGSVKIHQNRWYTVTQQMQGSKSFYGMNGQKQVQGKGVVITFRRSPMDKNKTNVESGQIPALLYS